MALPDISAINVSFQNSVFHKRYHVCKVRSQAEINAVVKSLVSQARPLSGFFDIAPDIIFCKRPKIDGSMGGIADG